MFKRMNPAMVAVMALVSMTSFHAQAQLVSLSASALYQGDEYVNDRPTGKICYVQVERGEELQAKGKHCQSLNVRFLHNSKKEMTSMDFFTLQSRVTNQDNHETRHLGRTCAEKVVDAPAGVSTFSEDTTYLYNELFAAESSDRKTHYFLSFAGDDKTPWRSRIHRISWFSETDLDCLNLQEAR